MHFYKYVIRVKKEGYKEGRLHKNYRYVPASWSFWSYPKPRMYSDRGIKSMVDMPPVWHAAKKWKRRASERLFAPRDYNGYGKAGLNPLEWAYEWSPFSVIIGALSTAQCRARNWHAKIGCDPIVGYCPISKLPPHPCTPALSPCGLSFRIFRRFDSLGSPTSSIDLRGLTGEKNFP